MSCFSCFAIIPHISRKTTALVCRFSTSIAKTENVAQARIREIVRGRIMRESWGEAPRHRRQGRLGEELQHSRDFYDFLSNI